MLTSTKINGVLFPENCSATFFWVNNIFLLAKPTNRYNLQSDGNVTRNVANLLCHLLPAGHYWCMTVPLLGLPYHHIDCGFCNYVRWYKRLYVKKMLQWKLEQGVETQWEHGRAPSRWQTLKIYLKLQPENWQRHLLQQQSDTAPAQPILKMSNLCSSRQNYSQGKRESVNQGCMPEFLTIGIEW